MAYVLRPYRRFPAFCPVRYENRFHSAHGTVTNLSPRGWRIHGDARLQAGDVCSMKVRLATGKWVSVSAGIVRWVRGEECGIETLVMNDESQVQLNDYIQARMKAL